jgi:hypothetical protein
VPVPVPVPVPGWLGGKEGLRRAGSSSPPHLAPSRGFRAVARGGSGRLGAGAELVSGDGDRLPLGEPGAGGERLIELARAQPLADLGHQVGLHPSQRRPRREPDAPAQALGRSFQARRPLWVSLRERQLGIPGQAVH